MPTSERLETLKRAFWVALIPGAILFMTMQTVVYARAGMIGADSHAYWMAARLPETWYTQPPAYRDAFLYSPAFAQVLWPLGQLPWPAFQAVWIAGQVGVLAWLMAPLGWQRGLTVAPFFVTEILLGNVYFFFAGALVVSLRRAPWALALPVLTKIAPGVVGVWFVVRREWRSALWAVGTTVVIVALSYAIAPAAWGGLGPVPGGVGGPTRRHRRPSRFGRPRGRDLGCKDWTRLAAGPSSDPRLPGPGRIWSARCAFRHTSPVAVRANRACREGS